MKRRQLLQKYAKEVRITTAFSKLTRGKAEGKWIRKPVPGRLKDEEKWIVFVTIQAQVKSVWRSDSGLSPGTVISISYEHTEHKDGYFGAREVPILAAHLWYPAYLTGGAQSGTYSPAARGYSFETVKWPSMFNLRSNYPRRLFHRANAKID